MKNQNEKDLTPQGGENQPENEKATPENQVPDQPKPKTKKVPLWLWLLLGGGILLLVILIAIPKSDKETEEKQKTEQTDPAPPPPPPVVIEVQKVDRVITLSNLTEKQKALLVKTTTPDLRGEKVLFVYLISEPLFGDMYWIQTDPDDGTVRNIFTYPANVIVKN
jgi:hypothetical protein